MSGKKRSEVAAVLQKAASARAASEANYAATVSNTEKNIISESAETADMIMKIREVDISFSADSLEKFADDVKAVRAAAAEIETEIPCGDLSGKLKKIISKSKTYDDEIQKLDDQAGDLRRRIQNKPHYCDPEFAEATQILNDYKSVNAKKNTLLTEIAALEKESAAQKVRAAALLRKKQQLAENAENINKKAAALAELKRKADSAKNYAKENFNAVDSKIAEKFMSAEFAALRTQLENFCASSDENAVNSISSMLSAVSNFSLELDSRYSKWLEEKQRTENLLELLKKRCADGRFYRPLEYLAHKDNADSVDMFTFLREFFSTDFEEQYTALLDSAVSALNAEDFAKAADLISQADAVVSQAREKADSLQTRLINTSQMAVDTRDIMLRMGYDVTAEFVNGESPVDGFRIVCKLGDEVIDFENVSVNEDGSVKMDIDHTESSSTTCGVQWERLKSEFNEYGIPMTDVKKNGCSVIDRAASKAPGSGMRGTAR